MSTAGKVLIVLVMLVIVVWIVLAAGVSQLNTNGNTKLHDLQTQVEKLEGDVAKTQADVVSLIDSTSQVRTQIDLDVHGAACPPNRRREDPLSDPGDALAASVSARDRPGNHRQRRRPRSKTATPSCKMKQRD